MILKMNEGLFIGLVLMRKDNWFVPIFKQTGSSNSFLFSLFGINNIRIRLLILVNILAQEF